MLTPGRASDRKNSAPILLIDTPEKKNVMKMKPNPIGKRTINRYYIYISSFGSSLLNLHYLVCFNNI